MIELTKEFETKREKLEAQLKKAEQSRDNAVKKIEALKRQISEFDLHCKNEIINSFISSAQEIGLASDSPEDLQAFFNGLLVKSSSASENKVSDAKESLLVESVSEDSGEETDDEIDDVLDRIRKE